MTLSITKHSEIFSSAPQINPEDIAEIAALGYKAIINARPDNEGGANQPASIILQSAAEKAGLHYIHIPVIPNNIKEGDITTCVHFVTNTPTPMLGFCRTGMRATNLHTLAQQKVNPNTAPTKQNWLTNKLSHFFQNKCLITKLYRKINTKQ